MEPKRGERGNILVSSLLILVVMNLLGASMVNTSVSESKMSSFKMIDTMVFHVTESCTKTAIDWLLDKTAPEPTTSFPHIIDNGDDMSAMMIDATGDESIMNNYSFDCEIEYLSMKEVSGGSGTDVSIGSGYGGSTTIRYFYEIKSTGSGPRNASKTTYTIVSVNY